MQPRVIAGFNDSVSVERGPLVFAYSIGQDWLKLRDRGLTADWQVYPASRWNYALDLEPSTQAKEISVSESALTDRPFALEGTPTQLRVPARLLSTWLASEGVAGTLPKSPVDSMEQAGNDHIGSLRSGEAAHNILSASQEQSSYVAPARRSFVPMHSTAGSVPRQRMIFEWFIWTGTRR